MKNNHTEYIIQGLGKLFLGQHTIQEKHMMRWYVCKMCKLNLHKYAQSFTDIKK